MFIFKHTLVVATGNHAKKKKKKKANYIFTTMNAFLKSNASRIHAYISLTPLNTIFIQ